MTASDIESSESVIKRTEALINYFFRTVNAKVTLSPFRGALLIDDEDKLSEYPILNSYGKMIGQLTFEKSELTIESKVMLNTLLLSLAEHIECLSIIEKLNQRQTSLDKQLLWKSSELADLYEDLNLAHEELNVLFNSEIALKDSLAGMKAQIGDFLENAPVAFGILKGKKLIIEVANRMILKVWGKTEEVVGLPLARAIPELTGQPYLQILEDIYTTGERYVGKQAEVLLERNGVVGIAYFNFIYEPIKSSQGVVHGIMIFANDVTEIISANRN